MIGTLFLAYMAVAWLLIHWAIKYCHEKGITIDAAYLLGLFWPVSIAIGIYICWRRHMAFRRMMRR